ncbi:hypothetical protein ETB97_001231 [Aspergillus alliaceus]|uniref:Uncharacterized protein n=1 Tax=Petromyces alliaceus TaxID=209559 RepID=A0A8H6A4A3_PETAA|nr:hypothetical protein ETB97_001231 [Aspergillus burnettii]
MSASCCSSETTTVSSPVLSLLLFPANQEDVDKLREHQKWLEALEWAKLNGEPWFPIKIDSVRKTEVFEKTRKETEDFYRTFKEENNAEIRRILWLSGPKAYGSMVTFLSQESDMTRLLHQKAMAINKRDAKLQRCVESALDHIKNTNVQKPRSAMKSTGYKAEGKETRLLSANAIQHNMDLITVRSKRHLQP